MSKIMIVDDDPCLRDAYKKLLTTNGFDVAQADGVKAGEEVPRGEASPNLFLMDIRKSDGPALFEMIRAYYPKAKILLTGAYQLAEQKRMIDEADDFFDKSTGAQTLIEKINSALWPSSN